MRGCRIGKRAERCWIERGGGSSLWEAAEEEEEEEEEMVLVKSQHAQLRSGENLELCSDD